MGTHDGHRERVRKRYLNAGLDAFDDTQVLEFLLFFTVPRQDTAPIARRLLERFGSLASVLEAPPEELRQFGGIGESSAVLLSLFRAVAQRHLRERVSVGTVLSNGDEYGDYLLPYFLGQRDELVYLLCLDGRRKVRNCQMLHHGSVNSVTFPIRRLVETAVACGASSVVLAHNHPCGIAVPSYEDKQATCRVRDALMCMDIRLDDHIVVANDDYVSMADSGFEFY